MSRPRFAQSVAELLTAAVRVDEARALLEHAVRELAVRLHGRARGGDQPALHRVRRERRVVLQHQRDDARGDGRRLRRAGHREHLLDRSLHRVRVEVREVAAARHRRGDVAARRDELRLHEAFERRAGRGERRELVVVRVVRRVAVRERADGDDVRHVARHVDRHRIRAVVARGRRRPRCPRATRPSRPGSAGRPSSTTAAARRTTGSARGSCTSCGSRRSS